MQKIKNKRIRLSKNIVPIKYYIELKPDMQNFTFVGKETILINLLKDIKKITLHSKDIDIETVNVISYKEKVFTDKITYDEKTETATFHFKKEIRKGKTKLTIVFQGILNDKMRGFYRSKYQLEGKEQHIATTQFEATDARRAFPCFDEPAQKSIFNVSLVVPKGHSAISNTLPISVKEHEAGYEIVHFSPTPKMSTYLLAFIVGNFEYVEGKTKNNVLVRIFTTPGKLHQAKFALSTTIKVLEFYDKYFDIPYPLPTLDMIAIPDFSSLAMENWGAITFREIGLLVDEKNTSLGTKEMIAEVIAHEIAHQWFGNLVTMEWWTHLWLNEGFASYIPYIAIHNIFPKWNIWERFITDTHGVAIRLDSLLNTHPIEVKVNSPDEIGEIFDAVSYSKGASVIAMLAEYLGEDNFRKGLKYYLKKHSYKNTETIHLWEAFEKVSKMPVKKIMKNWTSKSGYPLVSVNCNKGKLVLNQERFFASLESKKKGNDKTIWYIPISLGNNSKKEKIHFSKKTTEIDLDDNKNNWLKINLGENGFFRTLYSEELLEKLKDPIKKKILPTYDRLGIIRDLFALAEAGKISIKTTLDFLEVYKNEDSYVVWVEIGRGLAQIEQIIAKTPFKMDFDLYISELFSPCLNRLGWNVIDNEMNTDTLLRSMLINRLGRSRDKEVVKKAKVLWEEINKGEQIHPDIRGAIYTTIASNGGEKEYKRMIEMYKNENMHEEKNRIGNALGDFRQKEILRKVCEFSISSDVRYQDTIGILFSVGMNPYGRDVWWSFVKKNWKLLLSRYGEGIHALGKILKAISGSAEKKHLTSFQQFFKSNNAPGTERSLEQIMERMENNIAWLKRDKTAINKFLQ
ncbi:MAG: M1 family metallopeptidase [Candidatus Paceibacterota bacterium]|jgi:puromycin-sensitive aminopeptidase